MPAEEFEVRTAVVVSEQNILTVVAALNNLLRLTRNDDSGHARHADKLPLAGRKVNKKGDCASLLISWNRPQFSASGFSWHITPDWRNSTLGPKRQSYRVGDIAVTCVPYDGTRESNLVRSV